MSSLASGSHLGSYEILSPIGAGGMGEVYKARDMRLNRTVAIKVLPPHFSDNPEMKQRFEREAQILTSLSHPHICPVFDIGHEGSLDYLVMEFLDGQTLAQQLEKGPLPLPEALEIAAQIADALDKAHAQGIVHRDLKTSNVMLTKNGAKLLDFGLAKSNKQAGSLSSLPTNIDVTVRGTVLGTLQYMAPEQVRGQELNARSDIFSFGVLLYELVSGRHPFAADSSAETIAAILTRDPEPLNHHVPDVPAELGRTTMKCLRKKPAERYQSMGDVAADIERIRSEIELGKDSSETKLEIAHVLFMDVVGFSRLPMDKQALVIRNLIEIVRGSPSFQNAESSDRLLRLPTGDGFALVFFGSPEEPVRCALEVSRSVRADSGIQLRMGIHTGPIYRVAGINAERNVTGGGINVAQRVMDCGDQGHILVSNAVAEILVQLSDWDGKLHDLGETEVKHGFRLHLYNLYAEDAGNPELPEKLRHRPAVVTAHKPWYVAIPRRWTAVAAFLMIAALGGVFVAGRISSETPQPHFQRLTFQQGTVLSARFAPDGRTVVYSAAWDGKPVDLFSTTSNSPESRSLDFSGSDILALSPMGELALLFKAGSNLDWGWKWGTLARASLSGGAPREVLREVQLADWSPDGGTLAVVRLATARSRVEFPIGTMLYETADRIGGLKVSPNGDLIAFAERPPGLGGSWSIGTLDLKGQKKILSSGWTGEFVDLAWSAADNEIWFNTRQGNDGSLHAVSLSGRHRLLREEAIPLQLFDVSRAGQALVGRIHSRSGILGLSPGATKERDLSWFDASELDDISQDGDSLLITEFGEGGGNQWSVYLRKTDGSPAVRLGDGQAFALSPDNSSALCLRRTSPPQLVVLPAGAGEPVSIKNENIADYYWGDWLPDGKRIVFSGAESGRGPRCYIQDVDGGKPQPITPEGTTLRIGQRVVSPDGEWILAMDFNEKASLYPVSGGNPRPVPGMQPGDVPIRWTADERSLLVFRKSESVPKVYAVDLSTGRNELWKEIMPADPAGIMNVWGVHIAPDDRSYYYSYTRSLSDLYLIEGLK